MPLSVFTNPPKNNIIEIYHTWGIYYGSNIGRQTGYRRFVESAF